MYLAINFNEFMQVLIEMAMIEDKSNISSENKLSMFLCKYLLKNSEKENFQDEISLTRWYFSLEQDDFRALIKKYLSTLYHKVYSYITFLIYH